jgi:hypothetical protein
MRRLAILLCAAGLLGGCAEKEWVYEKQGATAAKVDRDMALCRKEAHDPQTVALPGSPRIDRMVFNRCMERRGYTVRTEKPG